MKKRFVILCLAVVTVVLMLAGCELMPGGTHTSAIFQKPAATKKVTSGTQTINDFELIATDFEFTEKLYSEEYEALGLYYEADEGCMIAVVTLDAKNVGKETASVLPMYGDTEAKLIYDDGYEYNPTWSTMEKDAFVKVYGPLESAECCIMFQVPKEIATTKGSFSLIIESGKDSVEWKLQ